MLKYIFSLSFCLFIISYLNAEVKVSAYIDSYITADNEVIREGSYEDYRKFAVVNGRKNQFGLNIAQMTLSADFSKFYGVLTLQTGDIVEQAWVGDYPNIQEAYGGIKFNDRFSVDMGTFLTYVGVEVVHTHKNFLTSHSIVTFIEPFYHNGIRFNFQITDEFSAKLLLMNGAWTIQEDNENKTLGVFLAYEQPKWSITYAGAYGNEDPGPPGLGRFQMFNNVCFYYQPTEKLSLIAQVDLQNIFARQTNTDSDIMLMGFAVQGKYKITDEFSTALRFAYVDNKDGIAPLAPVGGFDATLGLEYRPIDNAYIRLEGRLINFEEGDLAQGKIFWNGKEYTTSRADLTLNMCVYFDLIK